MTKKEKIINIINFTLRVSNATEKELTLINEIIQNILNAEWAILISNIIEHTDNL